MGAISALFVLLGVGAVLTGRVGYVVTNGISMEPLYHTGDLVVFARASSYHVGEIVAYHGDLDGHLVVLHRIVGGNGSSGFLMKGDNNHRLDPVHPTASQVIGRAILHIPKVGIFMHLARGAGTARIGASSLFWSAWSWTLVARQPSGLAAGQPLGLVARRQPRLRPCSERGLGDRS